jgi:acyl-CoA reductase-like NAD-dependent aldehyde dehydrogenase
MAWDSKTPSLVTQARLLHMSPDSVYAELKEYAAYQDESSNYEDKILSKTSSGGVTINGLFSHYLENQLPFGGVNQSSMGSYHGVFGFRAFSHERAIYIQQTR